MTNFTIWHLDDGGVVKQGHYRPHVKENDKCGSWMDIELDPTFCPIYQDED